MQSYDVVRHVGGTHSSKRFPLEELASAAMEGCVRCAPAAVRPTAARSGARMETLVRASIAANQIRRWVNYLARPNYPSRTPSFPFCLAALTSKVALQGVIHLPLIDPSASQRSVVDRRKTKFLGGGAPNARNISPQLASGLASDSPNHPARSCRRVVFYREWKVRACMLDSRVKCRMVASREIASGKYADQIAPDRPRRKHLD